MVVLCGISGGTGSGHLAQSAEAISVRLGTDLVLVHVADAAVPSSVRPPWPFDPSTFRCGALERGAHCLASREVGPLLERGVRGRVELGDPVEHLAAVAAQERASIVVVGWKRSWRPFAQSFAERLMRRCPCPVLLIEPVTHGS